MITTKNIIFSKGNIAICKVIRKSIKYYKATINGDRLIYTEPITNKQLKEFKRSWGIQKEC